MESRIGRALVAGEVHDGSLVKVDVKEGHLAVAIENPKAAAVEDRVPVGA